MEKAWKMVEQLLKTTPNRFTYPLVCRSLVVFQQNERVIPELVKALFFKLENASFVVFHVIFRQENILFKKATYSFIVSE